MERELGLELKGNEAGRRNVVQFVALFPFSRDYSYALLSREDPTNSPS